MNFVTVSYQISVVSESKFYCDAETIVSELNIAYEKSFLGSLKPGKVFIAVPGKLTAQKRGDFTLTKGIQFKTSLNDTCIKGLINMGVYLPSSFHSIQVD